MKAFGRSASPPADRIESRRQRPRRRPPLRPRKADPMKKSFFAAFVTLALAAAFIAGPAVGQTPAPKAAPPAKKGATAAKATSAPRNTLAKLKSTGIDQHRVLRRLAAVFVRGREAAAGGLFDRPLQARDRATGARGRRAGAQGQLDRGHRRRAARHGRVRQGRHRMRQHHGNAHADGGRRFLVARSFSTAAAFSSRARPCRNSPTLPARTSASSRARRPRRGSTPR